MRNLLPALLITLMLTSGCSEKRKTDGTGEISVPDSMGRTILHLSILEGRDDFSGLIEKKDFKGSKDNEGETPLHYAVKFRSNKAFEALLKAGVEIDSADNNGNTPLSFAIQLKQYDMAKKLVEKGADINKGNSAGVTPFMFAVNSGKKSAPEIVRYLLEKGAKIDQKDNLGRTALFYAAGKIWVDITEILVNAGADVTVHDSAGRSLDYLLTGEGSKDDRYKIKQLIAGVRK